VPLGAVVHKVVLTFDDGPVPEHTPRILDALAKYNIPGLFFVIGERLRAPGSREIVRRAVSEGHLIGNHAFDHQNLTKLSPQQVRSQILRTHELISEFEPRRRLFRPPYGAYNDTVKAVAKELEYRIVLWSASSEDWRAENWSSAWVDIAVEQISAQHLAICLCHDLPHTAAHLPQLIETVQQRSSHKFVSYYGRRDLKWLVGGMGRRAHDWVKWKKPRSEGEMRLPAPQAEAVDRAHEATTKDCP
jgi:peptidoglycan-N-acetylglucosamine deacetylase